MAEVEIVFDGGSLGNPGHGYGSYQLATANPESKLAVPRIVRLVFGEYLTNNEAEYMALIGALEDVTRELAQRTQPVRLIVRGDSKLVLEQLAGRWKVRAPHLRPLHDRAAELLKGFGEVKFEWHPRAASVKILGH